MNNKIVYVVTTTNCYACKCMLNILDDVKKEHDTFSIKEVDFKEVPEWLKINVLMTDFPTTIFLDNDIIKYHITGTLSKNKVITIMKDINY